VLILTDGLSPATETEDVLLILQRGINMPRKQKKYHYIYKTTNILNYKFYIGMHSTDDLDDGYVGSGKRL